MGLFSSKKTIKVNGSNTANVTVNPVTNANIVIDNSATAGAINSAIGALDGFVDSLAHGISATGRSIGGGINGAGANLAFGLIAGASIYALRG